MDVRVTLPVNTNSSAGENGFLAENGSLMNQTKEIQMETNNMKTDNTGPNYVKNVTDESTELRTNSKQNTEGTPKRTKEAMQNRAKEKAANTKTSADAKAASAADVEAGLSDIRNPIPANKASI